MRSSLIERITALAVEAEAGGELDTAQVLFLLAVSIGEGTDGALAQAIVAISRAPVVGPPPARQVSAA